MGTMLDCCSWIVGASSWKMCRVRMSRLALLLERDIGSIDEDGLSGNESLGGWPDCTLAELDDGSDGRIRRLLVGKGPWFDT